MIQRIGNNDVDVGSIYATFDAIKGRWPLAPVEEQQHDWSAEFECLYDSAFEVAPDVYAGWFEDNGEGDGACIMVWRKGMKWWEGVAIHRHRGLAMRINKAIKQLA